MRGYNENRVIYDGENMAWIYNARICAAFGIVFLHVAALFLSKFDVGAHTTLHLQPH